MADERYAIPLGPNRIGEGLDTILTALQHRRERQREEADRELRLRGIVNEETRTSNEEHRRKAETERLQRIEQGDTILKAAPLLESQPSLAKALLGSHGISTTDEMGQPSLFTPAMALAAANKTAPPPVPPPPPDPNAVDAVSGGQSSPVTPLNAFGHTGTTVPELQPTGYAGGGVDALTDEQRRRAAENVAGVASGTRLGSERTSAQIPPIDVSPPAPPAAPQAPPGHAVEDLLPMTEDAKPTGAMSFRGQGGVDLGRYDPAEKHGYEAEKAARVKEAFGPLGESYARISEMIAKGDISEKQGDVMMSMIASTNNTRDKLNQKDTAREDEQLHKELMAKLYRNEPLTFEMMKELARIRGQYGLQASGMVPTPPGVDTLIAMKNAGYPDEAIAAEAIRLKIPGKLWEPPVQNTVRNATASERAGQRREQLVATNAQGKQIGYWDNPIDARYGKEQNEAFQQVQARMQDLINHVKQYGNRIDINSQQYQDRLSMGASVNAALRPYNKLGGTDASQRLEADITGALGAPGHGWLLGANPAGLDRIMRHASERHDFMLNQRLRPGGGSQLPGALGGPGPGRAGQGGGAAEKWIAIPVRLRSKPEYAGKKEVSVDGDGNITGSR